MQYRSLSDLLPKSEHPLCIDAGARDVGMGRRQRGSAMISVLDFEDSEKYEHGLSVPDSGTLEMTPTIRG